MVSADVARRKAQALLGVMAEGKNPNRAKQSTFGDDVTVEAAFSAFFKAKTHLAAVTVENYSRTPRLYLADWARRPMRDHPPDGSGAPPEDC